MKYEVMYPLQRSAEERPLAPGKVVNMSEDDAAPLVENGSLRVVPGQDEDTAQTRDSAQGSQERQETPPTGGETPQPQDLSQEPQEPPRDATGENQVGAQASPEPEEIVDDAPDDSEPEPETTSEAPKAQKTNARGAKNK